MRAVSNLGDPLCHSGLTIWERQLVLMGRARRTLASVWVRVDDGWGVVWVWFGVFSVFSVWFGFCVCVSGGVIVL